MPHSRTRIRAGARATLALGIAASLAANVLAAQPTWIGRVIAAWPPVALLVTVELLSRVPVITGWLSRLRVVAAATIASIAAWVSYWHMVEVALEYGEAPIAAHLLPFSVDGLVVVASVCLVELGRQPDPEQAHDAAPEPLVIDTRPAAEPAPGPVESAPAEPKPAPASAELARPRTSTKRRKPKAKPAASGDKLAAAKKVLLDDPSLSLSAAAEKAGVGRSTVANARKALEAEAASAGTPEPDGSPESNGHGLTLVGATDG